MSAAAVRRTAGAAASSTFRLAQADEWFRVSAPLYARAAGSYSVSELARLTGRMRSTIAAAVAQRRLRRADDEPPSSCSVSRQDRGGGVRRGGVRYSRVQASPAEIAAWRLPSLEAVLTQHPGVPQDVRSWMPLCRCAQRHGLCRRTVLAWVRRYRIPTLVVGAAEPFRGHVWIHAPAVARVARAVRNRARAPPRVATDARRERRP